VRPAFRFLPCLFSVRIAEPLFGVRLQGNYFLFRVEYLQFDDLLYPPLGRPYATSFCRPLSDAPTRPVRILSFSDFPSNGLFFLSQILVRALLSVCPMPPYLRVDPGLFSVLAILHRPPHAAYTRVLSFFYECSLFAFHKPLLSFHGFRPRAGSSPLRRRFFLISNKLPAHHSDVSVPHYCASATANLPYYVPLLWSL